MVTSIQNTDYQILWLWCPALKPTQAESMNLLIPLVHSELPALHSKNNAHRLKKFSVCQPIGVCWLAFHPYTTCSPFQIRVSEVEILLTNVFESSQAHCYASHYHSFNYCSMWLARFLHAAVGLPTFESHLNKCYGYLTGSSSACLVKTDVTLACTAVMMLSSSSPPHTLQTPLFSRVVCV